MKNILKGRGLNAPVPEPLHSGGTPPAIRKVCLEEYPGSPFFIAGGKLKTRSKKEGKKHREATPGEYEAYAHQYLGSTLNELGLSPEDNVTRVLNEATGEYHQLPRFTAGEYARWVQGTQHLIGYGLKFLYLDFEGKPYIETAQFSGSNFYQKEPQQKKSRSEVFTRLRFAPGLERTDLVTGKLAKYHTPRGMSSHFYFTSLWHYFISKGVTELPAVVIVEGEKKAEALCRQGIPAIGTTGIYGIADKILNRAGKVIGYRFKTELQRFLSKFGTTSIIQLHDADAPDNKRSERKQRARGFLGSVRHLQGACATLKKETGISISHTYKVVKGPEKGIDDLIAGRPGHVAGIKNEMLQEATFKGSYLVSYRVTDKHSLNRIGLYLKAKSCTPDDVIEVHKYLSEKTDTIITRLNAYGRIVLEAPTGSGKTTLVMEELREKWPGRIVVMQPLCAIADNVFQSYKEKGVAVIMGGAGEDEIQEASNCKVIVCTYDSYDKIRSLLDKEKTLFVLDEIHYPVLEYEFKDRSQVGTGDRYSEMVTELLHMHKVLAISATPPQYLKKLHFRHLQVIPEITTRYNYKQIEYTGKAHHALLQLFTGDQLPEGKTLIRYNGGEDEVEDLMARIRTQTGLPEQAVQYLRSSRKKGDLYNYIVTKERIPEEVKILILTTVADCGLNLLNEDITAAIILDRERSHPSHVIQFAARARKVKELALFHMVKPGQNTHLHGGRQFFRQWEELFKTAQVYNQATEQHRNYHQRFNKQAAPVLPFAQYDRDLVTIDGKVLPNLVKVLHDAEKDFSKKLTNETYLQYLDSLPNFNVIEGEQLEAVADPLLQAADENRKEARKTRKELQAELIENEAGKVLEAYYYFKADHGFRKDLRARFGYSGAIAPEEVAVYYEQHKSLFKEIGRMLHRYLELLDWHIPCSKRLLLMSSAAYGLHRGRILWHGRLESTAPLRPLEQADKDNILELREALKALEGEEQTAETLRELVNQVYVKNFTYYDTRKAMKLVNTLYRVEDRVYKDPETKKASRAYTLEEPYTFDAAVTEMIDQAQAKKVKSVTELMLTINNKINSNSVTDGETTTP